MAGGSSHEGRTEAATPRRLQRARDEGDIPVSREFATFAALAAVTLVLLMAMPRIAHDTVLELGGFLAQAHDWDMTDGGAGALRIAAAATLRAAAPLALAGLAGGAAAVLLQTGFLLNGSALGADFRRVSPAAGLRRLFSPDSLVELGKSIIKLGVLGAAVWHVIATSVGALAMAPYWDVATLAQRTLREITQVLAAVLAAQLAIAGLDVFWGRFRHGQQLRMSREDIRQDQKETDGDPRVKARLRQIRMQRARKRMLAAVPKATVVLTNPTHYAVALTYDRARNAAPRVVAKGVDIMAARIRAIAQDYRVPLVANPPLARALHRVELDTEIPAEHYQAVAEIIAYVWRLGQRAGAGMQ